MKIVYCIESLCNSGGMERMLSIMVNALAEEHDITIVTACQGDRPDYFPLDKRIKRVDLGVKAEGRHIPILKNPLLQDYKKKLSQFLCSDKFDIVISMGSLELNFLPLIHDGSKKIVWFHFAYDVCEMWASSKYKNKLVAKLVGKLQTQRRMSYAKRFDKIVVLTKADLQHWNAHCDNAVSIYNPLTISATRLSDTTPKSAIAVGRLDYQKGFDFLINAWAIVNKTHPDWHLNIWGTGSKEAELKSQIAANGLDDKIFLRGRTEHIEQEYPNNGFFILSSRAEGLGLVLIEAATCGLPLVSYDCHYGPNEIISEGENGYLVSPVGDVERLAAAIDRMMSDGQKRQAMGRRAKQMAKQFELEPIKEQWNRLFEDITLS